MNITRCDNIMNWITPFPFSIPTLTHLLTRLAKMASLTPRASVFWSDSIMSNSYFPDDTDADQHQRLVDPDADDPDDDRTPVRIFRPDSPAVTVVDKTRTARQDDRSDWHGQLSMGLVVIVWFRCVKTPSHPPFIPFLNQDYARRMDGRQRTLLILALLSGSTLVFILLQMWIQAVAIILPRVQQHYSGTRLFLYFSSHVVPHPRLPKSY